MQGNGPFALDLGIMLSLIRGAHLLLLLFLFFYNPCTRSSFCLSLSVLFFSFIFFLLFPSLAQPYSLSMCSQARNEDRVANIDAILGELLSDYTGLCGAISVCVCAVCVRVCVCTSM